MNPYMEDQNKRNSEDEYQEDEIYFCYSATLRIFGDDIGDFKEISDELGLEPSHTHKKGEPRSKKIPTPWNFDMWMYESPVPEDRPLDEHIQMLWNTIKTHKDFLISLKEKFTVDVFCGYRSNSGTAGFKVSPSSLEMFIELDIPFGVSVIVA